jgi:hypothetical protein
VATDKFKGRYGILFLAQSNETYLYTGVMMVVKLLRAIFLGFLVGVLEGKLQVGLILSLQVARWGWLLFRFTSTERPNDIKAIFYGFLEMIITSIFISFPVKGSLVNTTEYAGRVQAVLFLSMFIIYSQTQWLWLWI